MLSSIVLKMYMLYLKNAVLLSNVNYYPSRVQVMIFLHW